MADSIVSITAPASLASRRLCTLAAVKAELGITDNVQDAALTAAIDEASSVIASYCGRCFAVQGVSEVWRRPARSALVLRFRPVTALASVTVDGTTLAGTDYEIDGEAGLLWPLSGDCRTAWTGSKTVVAYTAGYTAPDTGTGFTLPLAVSRAAVLLVSSMRLSAGRDLNVRSRSAEGVGSTSYVDARTGMEALPPVVGGLLEPFIERRIA